jgi:hypothetical protein
MRWLLLLAATLATALFVTASIYNAWVSATPVGDPEAFRMRAVVYFDLTILAFMATAAFFIMSKPRSPLRWIALCVYAPIGIGLLVCVIAGPRNVHEYPSWELWNFTQYPISVLLIMLGIGLFVYLSPSKVSSV